MSERDIVADHINDERFQQVKKKLILFYILNVVILAAFSAATAIWWNKRTEGSTAEEWRIITAKCVPSAIYTLFILFNVWIQCSNRAISRDIIHPWVTCRCYMYVFLFVMPLVITTCEVVGLCQYYRLFSTDAIYTGFYYLMGLSLIPTTWFQFTIVKWLFFVKRYSVIRERRLEQQILLLD
jgi:uncharacterized membrane protein